MSIRPHVTPQASDRRGPASKMPGPASEKPGPASKRPEPVSEGPGPASEGPRGGMCGHTDEQIPPVFYSTLSPLVPSGAAALLT